MVKLIEGKLFTVNAVLAAFMVKMGATVVALCANKYNPVATAFYFKNDEAAQAAVEQWNRNAMNGTY